MSTNQNTHSVHVIYLRGTSQNGGGTQVNTLNLSKRFIIVRLSKTFHLQSDPHSADYPLTPTPQTELKVPGDQYMYVYLIGHSPSGLFRTNANNDKLIFKINTTRLRIPTGGRQTSWLFTSIAKRLELVATENNIS